MPRRLNGGADVSACQLRLLEPSSERERRVPAANEVNLQFCMPVLALILIVLLPSFTWAAALPDQLGSFRKVETGAVSLTDEPVWREFGLISSESGKYEAKGKKVDLTAYRFKDTTGALAAWEWLRPAEAKPCQLAPFCAETSEEKLLFDLNYVVILRNSNLKKADIAAIFQALPETRETSLPPVLTSVPREGMVPNSARYSLGPASFRKFAPALSGIDPGFAQGAEAHFTSYVVHGKPVRLVLFYYPTPELARIHQGSFQKVPQTVVKRSGPLVAVALDPASPQQAEALLRKVEYQAQITWNDVPPANPVRTLYQMFVGVIVLVLILVALCAAAGAVFAGLKFYRRQHGAVGSEEAMTRLNLRVD